MCPVNDGIEDTEHLLLLYNSFRKQRCRVLAGVNDVLEACGYCEGAHINMLQLLLYGNKKFPLETNKILLNLTIKYISETESFGWRLLESLKRALKSLLYVSVFQ